METALRVAIVVAVAALALWVATYLHENPVEREIVRLGAVVEVLRQANDNLRQENDRYRTNVQGLREDPDIMDRWARDSLGMSRPEETVILFRGP